MKAAISDVPLWAELAGPGLGGVNGHKVHKSPFISVTWPNTTKSHPHTVPRALGAVMQDNVKEASKQICVYLHRSGGINVRNASGVA